jgi:hypothetical protein
MIDAPFLDGLQDVVDELARWMMYIVPLAVAVTFLIGGLMLAKAEDGMESKQIKEKMVKAIIGIGIAGSAVAIGKWLGPIFFPGA